jgi:NADH:ubiquinone oxidoreductase subunit
MGLFGKIMTSSDGATLTTLFTSRFRSEQVGTDAAGNRYYRSRDGKRRWVLYADSTDSSTVSPDWHGWLHGTHDALPEEGLPPVRPWQIEGGVNATGTSDAYRPAGALERGGRRQMASGDYQPWTPDAA